MDSPPVTTRFNTVNAFCPRCGRMIQFYQTDGPLLQAHHIQCPACNRQSVLCFMGVDPVAIILAGTPENTLTEILVTIARAIRKGAKP